MFVSETPVLFVKCGLCLVGAAYNLTKVSPSAAASRSTSNVPVCVVFADCQEFSPRLTHVRVVDGPEGGPYLLQYSLSVVSLADGN